jgi:NAD(P)H-hydrate repair Nnr-like enzyme with NAD(P)H-hydrate epimerase domain
MTFLEEVLQPRNRVKEAAKNEAEVEEIRAIGPEVIEKLGNPEEILMENAGLARCAAVPKSVSPGSASSSSA